MSANWLPASYTPTQYVPACATPLSCAVVPAWVGPAPPLKKAHVDPLGAPMPSPTVTVDGGPAAVRVTFSRPFDRTTVKACEADPPTATVPVKTSVVGGVVVAPVAVGAVVLLPPHADAASPVDSASPIHAARRNRDVNRCTVVLSTGSAFGRRDSASSHSSGFPAGVS